MQKINRHFYFTRIGLVFGMLVSLNLAFLVGPINVSAVDVGGFCTNDTDCVTNKCNTTDPKNQFCDYESFSQCVTQYHQSDPQACCSVNPSWPESKMPPCTSSNTTGSGGGAGAAAGGSPAGAGGGSGCTNGYQSVNGIDVPCSPFSANSNSIASSQTATDLIAKIIKFLLLMAGIIAVLFIIIGGFWYLTSAGNEEQAEKGRKTLISAIIGVVVIALAYTIVTIIVNTVTK